jgi:two-component sensor histidine kinase
MQCYYQKGDSVRALQMTVKALEEFRELEASWNEKKLNELEARYETREKNEQLKINKLTIQNQKADIIAGKQRVFYLVVGIILSVVFILVLVYFYRRSILQKRKIKEAGERLEDQNNQLVRLLKENEFLLQESHHRIKNNLQLIISIIQMEVSKSAGPDTMVQLENISGRIQAISALHKQLYVNQEMESISGRKYFSDIKDNMSHLLHTKGIQIELRGDNIQMPIKIAVYMGLIFTELLTNSTKHAFKNSQQKRIQFDFSETNEGYAFRYNDNGENEFKINDKGKGIHLIDLLCRQIKGVMKTYNDNGYTFNLAVPK